MTSAYQTAGVQYDTNEEPSGSGGRYIVYREEDFTVVQLQLTGGVEESADVEGFRAYIGYDDEGNSFIVDSGWSDADGQTIVQVYQTLLGDSAIPLFLYLTHAHPDHQWGLDAIIDQWPSLTIYVGVRGIITDITNWNNLNNHAVSYESNLKVLDTDLEYWGAGSVYAVVNLLGVETSYAAMLMVTVNERKMLFTGDLISPRSALYMYNPYNGYDTFPQADDLPCQWASNMYYTMCSLDDDTEMYAGHGPTSMDYELQTGLDWRDSIQENIEWLRNFRKVAYNTCNSTYGWELMHQQYPTFGMLHYSSIFGLASWFPYAAAYLGCSCISSSTLDASGIPQYTPNDCNVDLDLIPTCGVFDNSYTIGQRCAAVGATTQSAYSVSSTSSSSNNDNNDDDDVASEVLVPLVATLTAIAIVILLLVLWNFSLVFRRQRAEASTDAAASHATSTGTANPMSSTQEVEMQQQQQA